MKGWFRLQFKLDSSFSNISFELVLSRWMVKDVYIDRSYIASSANAGINGKPYKESMLPFNSPGIPLSLKPG